VARKVAKDKRFPVVTLDNPLRRLLENQHQYDAYVEPGQVVADLGSGPGFHTLSLAARVGPRGHVYATDFDAASIRALERKAGQEGLTNVSAHAGSAVDLSYIPSESVDFVLANGLLCCMAPAHHAPALAEIKRILKPGGKAMIVIGRGRGSYVSRDEWHAILCEFAVERSDDGGRWWGDRTALVHKLP
jgi:ubiquinone/menaquinone biosynthesis C-methylase UbiE